MQNETAYPVTLAGDSFALAVTLTEGDNLFTLFARDVNSDTGRSAQMNYPRLVDQRPIQFSSSISAMPPFNSTPRVPPIHRAIR